MFDAERLLGSLVKGSLGLSPRRRRRGRGFFSSSIGRTLGAGLLGAAFAAFDTYQKSQTDPSAPPRPMVPPSPPGSEEIKKPPPPPGAVPPAPPPLKEPPNERSPVEPPPDKDKQARTLLQAMIAAAGSDGIIDAKEQEHILEKAREVGSDAVSFVKNEISNPKDVSHICAQVDSSELAEQVYLVSALAIDLDTDAEKAYLKQLAQQLGIKEEHRLSLNKELEIE